MTDTLLTTPLHAMHVKAGAKMVLFAGYQMPVHYTLGIKQEHLHCRAAAGLFDVSHMGQLRLTGPSVDAVATALESVCPADYVNLASGRQRYGVLTNGAGGIIDDVMITRVKDHFLVVVNAAGKQQNIAHLQAQLPASITVQELTKHALLALQGPQAVAVMARLAPQVPAMRFMDVQPISLWGHDCFVARAGYTGEDGVEISVPADCAETLAATLLADDAVQWIGLGARDSLRLEAGLSLYGQDLDQTTSLVSANLQWLMPKSRRPGGVRAGGFPGAKKLFTELEQGSQAVRVGLLPEGRVPVRAGAVIIDIADNIIGRVTSGGFSPTLGVPVAMGYVTNAYKAVGTQVFAVVRGKHLPCRIAKIPFVQHNYYYG
jgi:aminomethyltransferase